MSRDWAEELRRMGVAASGPRRVLLVDDEPDNLELLRAVLDEDHEVHTAASGAQALAMLERVDGFALVVSDQRMPGMTGIELLSEIARRWPQTVRMVLTGYSDLSPIVSAINEG